MRPNVAPSPEVREARALESLQNAEMEMLHHALRRLSEAQDAYVRMHGVSRGSPQAPAVRSAQSRLDKAAIDAALWRAIVEGRVPGS